MASKDSFEVEDSTDWLQTPLASLAPVEAAFRCQVCTEFYKTPMVTSCSHTFCSLCIRRCLSNDGKCPSCRTPDQELKLRCNWSLEEAVEAFKKAREGLLQHARTPKVVERPASPKRRREHSNEEDVPRKRTRSSARTRGNSSQPMVVVDSEDEDEDYIPDDGLVACPICNGRMTEKAVGEHIDRCTGVPPKTSRSAAKSSQAIPSLGHTSKPIPRPERLPHLHYSSYKEAALRKKLGELGISTSGSRSLLEKRHTEWVSIWNANCDSKAPRRKFDLKQDLDKWERTQGSGSLGIGGSSLKPGAQLLDKDFNGMAWASTHEDSFRELIANAKRKPPTGVATPAQPPANIQPVPETSSSQKSSTASTQPQTQSLPHQQPSSSMNSSTLASGPEDVFMSISSSSQSRSVPSLESIRGQTTESDIAAVRP